MVSLGCAIYIWSFRTKMFISELIIAHSKLDLKISEINTLLCGIWMQISSRIVFVLFLNCSRTRRDTLVGVSSWIPIEYGVYRGVQNT